MTDRFIFYRKKEEGFHKFRHDLPEESKQGEQKLRAIICPKRFKYYMDKGFELIKKTALIAFGNFLVAFAVVFFVLPNNILTGGTASLAIALNPIFHVNNVLMINILSVSLFFAGWLILGRAFAVRSALSTFVYPMFLSLLSLLDTSVFSSIDPFRASLYAGLIMGAGLGLVFKANASTGGMDIPALIIHKYCGIPINRCVLIVDSLTILFGVSIYGINSLLIGLISVLASSFAINWMSTLGSTAAKNVMIISDKYQEIQEYLLNNTRRGVTIMDARGAWTNQSHPVLMCVVTSRQFPQMEMEINELDPKAFIIVTDVHEVRGSGFTYEDGTI